MSLRSLLKKEFHWSKHNVAALLFILLVLPGFFAYTSVAFETVIPRDAPMAVVPGDENVTDNDMTIVKGSVTAFSDPVVVDSEERATRMLRREAVYSVLVVPPDITEADNDNASFTYTVDGSIVPYKEPSKALRNVMAFQFDSLLNADVSVDRRVLDPDNTLSEYLVPVFLMAILMLFAFTYVPYNLAQEAAVLDRLRAEASLEAVVGAKLVYFTLLMLVPILVFQGAAAALGYATNALAPAALVGLLLTFVVLAALAMAVMVVFRFGTMGRFVNVVLLLAVVGFSGLAYPVGYFSALRKTLVRLFPTHYAMVITRSGMLKGLDLSLFLDWVAGLLAVAGLALLALKLSAVYYRRTS
ncbi:MULTISPECIES: ABC transporter permease [Salinibaculum]|uniref:ABC transporter permease n=1 Tax=Salinibaculum TaxID=2732368 RepID=UPI0030CD1BF8